MTIGPGSGRQRLAFRETVTHTRWRPTLDEPLGVCKHCRAMPGWPEELRLYEAVWLRPPRTRADLFVLTGRPPARPIPVEIAIGV
jgi:hypothetical protein